MAKRKRRSFNMDNSALALIFYSQVFTPWCVYICTCIVEKKKDFISDEKTEHQSIFMRHEVCERLQENSKNLTKFHRGWEDITLSLKILPLCSSHRDKVRHPTTSSQPFTFLRNGEITPLVNSIHQSAGERPTQYW